MDFKELFDKLRQKEEEQTVSFSSGEDIEAYEEIDQDDDAEMPFFAITNGLDDYNTHASKRSVFDDYDEWESV